jgi:hypothetical protein
MYLQRCHDVTISPSGVWRILKRLDMSWLPSSQRYKRTQTRWKRYEKPLPGHQVQVDVKFLEPSVAPARSTTSSRPSMTAPASGSCASMTATTSAPPSSSWTTSSKAPVPGRMRPNRQRRRVPRRLPLAPTRSRDRPRLHQAQDPTAQRQGRAFPPHRRRRVLPNAQRRRHRRRRKSLTKSSRSGRTSTTSTDPTAAPMDRPPTNGYDKAHHPRRVNPGRQPHSRVGGPTQTLPTRLIPRSAVIRLSA